MYFFTAEVQSHYVNWALVGVKFLSLHFPKSRLKTLFFHLISSLGMVIKSFELSRQLLTKDLIRVSSVSLYMTSSAARAN